MTRNMKILTGLGGGTCSIAGGVILSREGTKWGMVNGILRMPGNDDPSYVEFHNKYSDHFDQKVNELLGPKGSEGENLDEMRKKIQDEFGEVITSKITENMDTEKVRYWTKVMIIGACQGRADNHENIQKIREKYCRI